MAIEKIRTEIYDDNGLSEVTFIEVEKPDVDELIKEREEQLLKIYEELELLKQQK